MARQIVFTPKAAKPPPAYSQAVKAAGLAKLPARIPGLKVSIAAIAEA